MDPRNELQFALSDLLQLMRRHKKTLLFWVGVGAVVAFLLSATRPVNYLVQATFRDKGKTEATIRSSLSDQLFSSSSGKDSEAASTMKSHQLISQTIGKLHAQGFVVKEEENSPLLQRSYDNLLSEWAYWNSVKIPFLEELESSLKVVDVDYQGETTIEFKLNFKDSRHFVLSDDQKRPVATGEIDQPLVFNKIRLTVKGSAPEPDGTYLLVLMPMAEVSKAFMSHLWIEPDKNDKTLLKLQFHHRDRHFAADFLNTLMQNYQTRLEEEHELISDTQVSYLERRQKEVGAQVEQLMHNFVLKASDDMSLSGFTSLQKEMDFLANNLALNQQKLTEIDLEVHRLQGINCDECVHFDKYRDNADETMINQLLDEIRLLFVQRDGLQLALQKYASASPEIEEDFQALELLHRKLEEVEQISQAIKTNSQDPLVLQVLNNPPLSDWYKSYKSKRNIAQEAQGTSKQVLTQDFEQFKHYFLSYLENFHRLLKIRYDTLSQQMNSREMGSSEMAGMPLKASQQLYTTYIQELHKLEAQEKQHRFLVEQIQKPDFEISSVAALLSDPVSSERINKTIQLLIKLKDENNRTFKERERLQEELALHTQFLFSHVEQTAELLHLNQQILSEKIVSLQILMLELTQQQIALAKKHFSDYIKSRIDNLNQEKISLQEHQASLHVRMSAIPPKWAEEQLLNQNLVLHQKFLENLSNMVESKNITKNLEMIQSSTLDRALAPLNPQPPRLIFFTLLGSLLGFIGSTCFLFARAMVKGIPASYDNLQLAHLHISGAITPFQGDEKSATMPLLDSDLDTLRRLIAHYESSLQKPTELLILTGKGNDFSNTLAMLLAKKGLRTLKLQLGFQDKQEEPGLLQYLEGSIDFPPIEHFDGFDLIRSGGPSRYSEELLRSQRFLSLLNSLKPSYDWIIGVTPIKIPSAEAENLAKLFTGTAIVVTDETLPNLLAFQATLDEKRKKALTFLFNADFG